MRIDLEVFYKVGVFSNAEPVVLPTYWLCRGL